MANKAIWAAFIAVALFFYASHTYSRHQAYKTGAYIGKAAFAAAEFQNRRCSSSAKPRCAVEDLNADSAMENALAAANIIPSLRDVPVIHSGFRDGWRAARTAAANR